MLINNAHKIIIVKIIIKKKMGQIVATCYFTKIIAKMESKLADSSSDKEHSGL